MACTMLREYMGEEELERALYADVAAADAAFLAHERNLLEELPQQLSSDSSSRRRALFFARVGALRNETMQFRESLLQLCDRLPLASRQQVCKHLAASAFSLSLEHSILFKELEAHQREGHDSLTLVAEVWAPLASSQHSRSPSQLMSSCCNVSASAPGVERDDLFHDGISLLPLRPLRRPRVPLGPRMPLQPSSPCVGSLIDQASLSGDEGASPLPQRTLNPVAAEPLQHARKIDNEPFYDIDELLFDMEM